MKSVLCGIVAGLVLTVAPAAMAAPSLKDKLEAQKHAAEGKKLAAEKDHKKAAKAYKKADEVVPSPAYKLEMARALVELDDLAQARDVLAACMEQANVAWNEKAVQKKCIELASDVDDRLPRLRVEVFKPSAEEVTIEIDDEEYDPGDGELSLNPGEVEVVAKAKGYKTFRKTIKLEERDRENIEISLEPTKQEEAAVAPEAEDEGGGLTPIPAYVLWGVGAVGIGLGVGFGVAAITTTNQVIEDYNCNDGECDPGAEEDLDVAKLNGNISTGAFIAGGVCLAAGTVLFIISVTGGDDGEDEGDSASVRPLIGPGFVGADGRF